MDWLEKSIQFLNDWFAVLWTPAGGWQLGAILIAATIGWYVHRRWRGFIVTQIGADEKRGYRRMAMRGSVRVVFPLVVAILLQTSSGILSQYKIATPLLDLLIPLLLSLAAIRAIVYALRRAFGPGPALRAWEGIISTFIWGAVALHLLGWLPDVLASMDSLGITLGKNRVTLLSVLQLALAVAVFMVLASWISRYIEQRAKRSEYLSISMQVGLSKISKVLLYTIAILVALNSVGIDLTTLTVFGGALGVGLGFGLQRIASNFISGFILLFDRSIKIGDVITIGPRFGWVVAMQARYIVVRDRDGVETLIPNENLITSDVVNWSFSDKHVRVKIPVQISYADDPEKAMELMIGACEASNRILSNPEPQSRMLEFGDSGINLELRVWLEDPEEGVGSVKSDVNLAIWRAFKEHGITIPFPQRDVHLLNSN